MKGFDLYLQQSQRTDPDWTENYIEYGVLKSRIQSYVVRRRALLNRLKEDGFLTEEALESMLDEKDVKSSTCGQSLDHPDGYFEYQDTDGTKLVSAEFASLRLSLTERADFSQLLEKNLRKAASFYSGTLLIDLLDRVSSATVDNAEEAGNEIVEVMAFVVANVISFRQLLIRYDAFCRTFDSLPLCEWELHRQMHENSFTMMFQTDALFKFRDELLPALSVAQGSALQEQIRLFHNLLERSSFSIDRAVDGHMVKRDRFRKYLMFGMQSRGLMFEPKLLLMRGKTLKEIKMVARWRATKNLPPEEAKEMTLYQRFQDLPPGNVFPLIINLMSCFLFMMNNYIIEPSSTYYANALGVNDAMSGIMVGFAPWFALISSIGYSIWTNVSYKQPMIFSVFLMVIGNWLYANAYTYKSFEICMIGRALTGLGAPRIINRRYVADATPFSLRTAASAAFIMSSVLGHSMGSFMSIILDLDSLEFEFEVPFLGKQYFNGMTGPGYFMCVSWALVGILIVLGFKEPDRSGIEELKKREQKSDDPPLMANSPDAFCDDGEESDWVDFHSAPATADKFVHGPPAIAHEEKISLHSPLYCIKHMTRAVVLCMSLIFMKRIAFESIVGATSIVTKNRYGWSIKEVGCLHLLNGILVIPVSAFAGWLSQFYEDRYLALRFLAITMVGMLFLVDVTDLIYFDDEDYNDENVFSTGPVRYIVGSLIAFSGIEACECYVASLMSKVVPSALAMGTFNSGLLTTLVGTG
eukprot:CAMPEP_0113327924 /NCGR_PEP_ID=MMETSP0010_2-20120614/19650_1 /TAXON_ID=216773 ORGANISM="Corethron hystrix, Strain 308" /NCGR_SAMPLE_ID=MMETSP0010_2 /ASSEMBLY_ACC=CAM_ASM_000155 /LENGTH=752 /DNA_ID=CAMNT_0000189027 /DNA_START=120 /DNA_END=2374 /DNA_ORIENTATION=+ /assembly_acc=CAM_ASM_000155